MSKTSYKTSTNMDAVNVMKGYDKVDHRDEIHSLGTHQRLKTAAAISAVVLLTLIIGLMLAVLIRESNTEEGQQLDAAESIKTVCSVTHNPDSCFTALSSSLNNISTATTRPDPEVILKLSLQVNVNEFSNVTSSFKGLYGNHTEAALRDCVDQLGDALSRLNDSVSEMNAPLTDRTVKDIQTWISAALTDQETCLDGLEEMGSRSTVESMMKKSKELLGYSLAIIANIRTLLQKFGLTLPMHMHMHMH